MQNQIYEIAKKEIGVQEIPGDKHNQRILEYHKTCLLQATSDETPWCSAFVNWCCKKAGVEGTKSAMARSWLLWGEKIKSPEVGDLVIFTRGKDGVSGHVGFLAAPIDPKSDWIRVLGGNQSNQVKISSYSKKALLGFRRAISSK